MLSLAAVINQVKRKIQANEIREINGKPSQCGGFRRRRNKIKSRQAGRGGKEMPKRAKEEEDVMAMVCWCGRLGAVGSTAGSGNEQMVIECAV
jgi:hypothetical protein